MQIFAQNQNSDSLLSFTFAILYGSIDVLFKQIFACFMNSFIQMEISNWKIQMYIPRYLIYIYV